MGLNNAELVNGLVVVFFALVLTSLLWWMITRILNLKEKGFKRSLIAASSGNGPVVLSLLFSTDSTQRVLGSFSGVLALFSLFLAPLMLLFSIKSLYGWKRKKTFMAFLIIFFCCVLSYISVLLLYAAFRPLK